MPADLRVLQSTDLKVENSSLTGESEPQERSADINHDIVSPDGNRHPLPPIEATNLLFYTTIVNSGSGRAVVIGTGDRTVMGQIAGLATETSVESTLINKEIKKFILFISIVAVTLGVSFFVIGALLGTDPIQNVVFTIGIIVANVPEGLLATVTVSLALTAKRMHAKNVLVKNLKAVETLGSTAVIASDKTGTLTQNRMTVQHCWYDGNICKIPAAKNRPQLEAALAAGHQTGHQIFNPKDPTFKSLHTVAALCNNSVFIATEEVQEVLEHQNQSDFNIFDLNSTSDASESALLKMTQLLRDTTEHRSTNPKLFEIKFNSTNKWQLSIHQIQGEMSPVLVLKGAPERVMRMCNRIMIQGEEFPLTQDWEQRYTNAYEEMGEMGERVLGFALKRLDKYSPDYPFTNKPEPNFDLNDLTFVDLISLIDPPREGVLEAVAKCKSRESRSLW